MLAEVAPLKTQKHFISIYCVCLGVILASTGCTSTLTEETIELSDFPQPEKPVVFSAGDPDAANAYTAGQRELTEAQWEVLEQYAPRNVWERIRAQNARLRALKDEVRQATPEQLTQKSLPAISDARVEDLGEDRIAMYYRVRYFGGIGIQAKSNGGTGRLQIVTDGKYHARKMGELVKLVQKRLGKAGSVELLAEENTLVIECTAESKQSVLTLLSHVDVPQPQVEISAEIFEVSHDMDFQAGVRLLINHMDLTGNQQGLASQFSAEAFAATASGAFPGNVPDPGSALRLVQTFGQSGIDVGATIQALASEGFLKTIASPRMTVTMGNTAYILAGQELPISSAKITSDGIVSEKTTYKPVGVQLFVTPQTVSDGSVRLHVITNVSSVQGFVELPDLNTLNSLTMPIMNPILDTREAETYVTVPDGGSLVIGGLRKVRSITGEEKIPGLGDIPVLGWFFKSHRSQRQVTDLYFFVTPRIVSR